MRVNKNAAGGFLAVAATAAILAGCGSNSTTHSSGPVQAGGVVAADHHTSTNNKVGTPVDNQTTSTPSDAVSNHTSTTPALTGAAQLAAARKVVQNKGYDSYDGQFWNSDHHLNALAGVLHESTDGHYQHLFFFVDGRYIGMDATAASGDVRIVGASNDVITVSYGIYKPTDALAMPSSRQQVRFEWTGSKLVPLDPIPPSATGTTAGR